MHLSRDLFRVSESIKNAHIEHFYISHLLYCTCNNLKFVIRIPLLCFKWRLFVRSLVGCVRWNMSHCFCVSGEGSLWESCTAMWDELWLTVHEKLVQPCEMNYDSLFLCFRWRQLMRSLYDHVRWIMTHCYCGLGEGSSCEAREAMWDELWLTVPLFKVKAACEKLVWPCEIKYDTLFVKSLYGHEIWLTVPLFYVKAAHEKLVLPCEMNYDSLFLNFRWRQLARSWVGHVTCAITMRHSSRVFRARRERSWRGWER